MRSGYDQYNIPEFKKRHQGQNSLVLGGLRFPNRSRSRTPMRINHDGLQIFELTMPQPKGLS